MVLLCAAAVRATPLDALHTYNEQLDTTLIDYYVDPDTATQPQPPAELLSALNPQFAKSIEETSTAKDILPARTGRIHGLMQQAITLKVADAVKAGDLATAKAWRCELSLPRGVSAVEGALLLEQLGGDPAKRNDAARLLTREAITWQTTLVRHLLDDAGRSAAGNDPMPGRLRERLAEATTLSNLPQPLLDAAGLKALPPVDPKTRDDELASVYAADWKNLPAVYKPLRKTLESSLPSLLTEKERERRERLLLKLVMLIPREYQSGVRDGKVTVALEYREAATFTAQARQLLGELAPIWLAESDAHRDALTNLEDTLGKADEQIAAVAPSDDLASTLKSGEKILTGDLGVSLARRGTTADIVEEVMLETRSLLNQSLASALNGNWSEAEQQRLEAYTTYDPELEARLLPRDPQLATDIEHLLLDGLDQPGVKMLLDKRAGSEELQAAYARVNEALDRATVQLKSDISPSAAVINAASIVLREGLEGLLVIIAIFAGLRGKENAHKRNFFWIGILASAAATAVTWLLSQTVITSLRNYGEIIECVTGIIAIGVLMLITNWLFHQVYWKQWITSLKSQAAGDESTAWTLITVGFAVGYREGFETVLFLQSLVLDAGGTSIGLGVLIGCVCLLVLGVAALKLGLKLPYFKLLMVTALLIGLVLVTFTGGTVRAMQTVGWIPVHKLTHGSWPMWVGNWLGLYNTWESFGGQVLAASVVLGTWRVARFQAKRKSAKRKEEMQAARECAMEASNPLSACDPDHCELMQPEPAGEQIVQIGLPNRQNIDRPASVPVVERQDERYSEDDVVTDDEPKLDAAPVETGRTR